MVIIIDNLANAKMLRKVNKSGMLIRSNNFAWCFVARDLYETNFDTFSDFLVHTCYNNNVFFQGYYYFIIIIILFYFFTVDTLLKESLQKQPQLHSKLRRRSISLCLPGGLYRPSLHERWIKLVCSFTVMLLFSNRLFEFYQVWVIFIRKIIKRLCLFLLLSYLII